MIDFIVGSPSSILLEKVVKGFIFFLEKKSLSPKLECSNGFVVVGRPSERKITAALSPQPVMKFLLLLLKTEMGEDKTNSKQTIRKNKGSSKNIC